MAVGTGSTDLLPVDLSLLFGQGRSDHATFAAAGCRPPSSPTRRRAATTRPRTTWTHLDVDKLARQIDLGEAVARAVAARAARRRSSPTPRPPRSTTPRTCWRWSAGRGRPRPLPGAEAHAAVEQFLAALETIVDDGEAAFGADDVATSLGGTAGLVELFAETDCDGSLD